jgi:hypothetical protein
VDAASASGGFVDRAASWRMGPGSGSTAARRGFDTAGVVGSRGSAIPAGPNVGTAASGAARVARIGGVDRIGTLSARADPVVAGAARCSGCAATTHRSAHGRAERVWLGAIANRPARVAAARFWPFCAPTGPAGRRHAARTSLARRTARTSLARRSARTSLARRTARISLARRAARISLARRTARTSPARRAAASSSHRTAVLWPRTTGFRHRQPPAARFVGAPADDVEAASARRVGPGAAQWMGSSPSRLPSPPNRPR